MDPDVIIRGALGHMASFGDLYDARTDNFCGISIFQNSVPPSSLTIHDEDSSATEMHLINKDSLTEMFSKLEVDAEQQVSLLAGLFSLEGSWANLTTPKKYARSVKTALLYKLKTKYEKVNFFREDLRDSFTTADIDRGIATHVVVGIYWGANTVLSCNCDNVENKDEIELQRILSSRMEGLSSTVLGKGLDSFSEADLYQNIPVFELTIFGDIISKGEQLPLTCDDATNFLTQIPSRVATSNGGKGMPVTYRMIPITRLQNYFNFFIKVDVTLGTLTDSTLTRIVKLFDEMLEINQELNEAYKDTYDSSCTLREEDMGYISGLQEKMTVQETLLREILSSVLTEVRSRKREVRDLDNLINRFKSSASMKRPGNTHILEMAPHEKKYKE